MRKSEERREARHGLRRGRRCCYNAVLNSIERRLETRMPNKTRIVTQGPRDRCVCTEDGEILEAPATWELLPPGDAALTRRVKAAGPSWTVRQKKGRRVFTLGVWAPADRIAEIRAQLDVERSTDAYAKRRQADKARRARRQDEYVGDFRQAVLEFLAFDPLHSELAAKVADAVAQHATPVGSGTVARTQRIPIAQRAESAVIAWLRHNTTAYDHMKIPRIKGKRREVRRMLAAESRRLLDIYRNGNSKQPGCVLQKALEE